MQEADEEVESSPKKNMITVEIPRAIFKVMEDSIKRGEYTSFQSVIEELVRGEVPVEGDKRGAQQRDTTALRQDHRRDVTI